MNRRDSVIALLAAATGSSSHSARAQTQGAPKAFVIALLPDFAKLWEPWLKTISEGLSALGRIEGRDYVFYRSGVFYGPDTQLALDRVLQAKPDLILVFNLGYAVAAHEVTKTIPDRSAGQRVPGGRRRRGEPDPAGQERDRHDHIRWGRGLRQAGAAGA